jgi:dihydroorotate dehydrogenase (NAD+) catalytic subunit
VTAWLAHELPALDERGARVVASIWGRSAEEYGQAAAMLAGAPGVVAVEVNVSCPNIEDRGRMFAHSAHATGQAVAASLACGLPLWVKLSPNVPDIVEIAGAALDAGAETLVLVNTVLGMAIDVTRRTYRLGSGGAGGGLSGPAIRPVAVRAVHDCRVAFPTVGIVGVGGVSRGVDVVEMMLAGADAVEVGTATFRDPRAPARVLAGLQRWCRWHDVGDVRRLVGAVEGAPVAPRPPEPRHHADPGAPVVPGAASSPRPAPPPPPPPPPGRSGERGTEPPRPGPVLRPDNPSRVPPLPPRPGSGPPGRDRG